MTNKADLTKQVTSNSVPSRPKDLCIWIVPPSSGKVKKFRMQIWTLAVVGGIAFLALGGMSYVAGDYTRLQIQRARNFLFVKSLTHERDTLKNSNRSLHSQVEDLRTQKEKLVSYEKSVRERLDELHSVVAAVQAMGVETKLSKNAPLARPDLKGSNSSQKAGIGGAEVECKPGDIRCVDLVLDDEAPEESVGIGTKIKDGILAPFRYVGKTAKSWFSKSDDPHDLVSDAELLGDLEGYIETLKVLPLGSPGPAAVTSGFGYRHSPFTHQVALHEGMDFSFPEGTDVLSTGDGIVKDVRYAAAYGLVVDIEHTPQVITRYAHLRKAFVRNGEKISRGNVIGLVGSTGRSTGPHLHYEIRIDGEARNPGDMIALGDRLSNIF